MSVANDRACLYVISSITYFIDMVNIHLALYVLLLVNFTLVRLLYGSARIQVVRG